MTVDIRVRVTISGSLFLISRACFWRGRIVAQQPARFIGPLSRNGLRSVKKKKKERKYSDDGTLSAPFGTPRERRTRWEKNKKKIKSKITNRVDDPSGV